MLGCDRQPNIPCSCYCNFHIKNKKNKLKYIQELNSPIIYFLDEGDVSIILTR